MRRVAAALALLALLTVGLADAHVETFSQSQTMRLGPYTGIVEPYPSPMFANSALTMRAVFSKNGSYATGLTVDMELTGPVGTARKPMEPDGTGYFVASVAVTWPGVYDAKVTVKDDAGSYENRTNFYVYPDASVRVRPGDQAQPDPYSNQTYPLKFEVVDNQTMRPTDKITDLSVRIEHWTDDHGQMLGQEDKRLERLGLGMWGDDHVFREKGMYHMRFLSRSGGFNYADTPILHVYANDPPPGTGGKDAPFAGVAGLVAAVLVSVLLARRR